MFLRRYVKGVPFFHKGYKNGKPFLVFWRNVIQVGHRDGTSGYNILKSTPRRGGGQGNNNNDNKTFVIQPVWEYNWGYDKKEL